MDIFIYFIFPNCSLRLLLQQNSPVSLLSNTSVLSWFCIYVIFFSRSVFCMCKILYLSFFVTVMLIVKLSLKWCKCSEQIKATFSSERSKWHAETTVLWVSMYSVLEYESYALAFFLWLMSCSLPVSSTLCLCVKIQEFSHVDLLLNLYLMAYNLI